MTAPIHTTLQCFTNVVNARGLDKTRLIRQQRQQFQARPRSRGGDFYAPFIGAVRKDLFAGGGDQHMADLLARCTSAQRAHFMPLVSGMKRLIAQRNVVGVAPAPRGLWWHDDLEINVTGLLGVRLATGEQQAWLLHKKEMALSAREADTPLYLADALLSSKGSELRAHVVDVRQARTFTICTAQERDNLRQLVEAEAESYVSLWRAAA